MIARTDEDGNPTQTLVEHCTNVADLCRRFAAKFGSENEAYIMGLLHDFGKASPEFQAYIQRRGDRPEDPYHTTYGTLQALRICEHLAFPISGHHTQIPSLTDVASEEGKYRNHPYLSVPEELCNLIPERICLDSKYTQDELGRDLWIRMLYSCLVDADWSDAGGREPLTFPSIESLLQTFSANQETLMSNNSSLPINQVRNRLYQDVISQACNTKGFYSLTAPTGSGKTRVYTGFSLQHILHNSMDRMIVVLPYISIIDQTARVYEEIFGEGVVVEHHSSIMYDRDTTQYLATENWDAPVIVTTAVQFLETLFSNITGKCRKLHNVVNSVIILDEAQMLPLHILTNTLDVLKRMVEDYGCSVVFSTATQPALDTHSVFSGNVVVQELVPNARELFSNLRRVRFEYLNRFNKVAWREVTDATEGENQFLIIVNTKRDAKILLGILYNQDIQDVFHLSTNMYPRHRQRVLAEISRRLTVGEPCRVVSTQVVEAGVDLDFPLVLRACAPLDSIVQAAGRCNREGRREIGRVIVFRPAFGATPDGSYQAGTDLSKIILRNAPDLHNPEIFVEYFRLWRSFVGDEKDAIITKNRKSLDFPAVRETYNVIEAATRPVMIREYLPEDVEVVRSIVNDVERFGVSKTSTRRLQPYLVSVYENDLNKHISKGRIAYDETLELHRWLGSYSDVSGIEREE